MDLARGVRKCTTPEGRLPNFPFAALRKGAVRMKWIYEIPLSELKNYKPEDVQVGYDRLDGRPITLSSIITFSLPSETDLKEPKIKDK